MKSILDSYFNSGVRNEKMFGLKDGFIPSGTLAEAELEILNEKLKNYFCEIANDFSPTLSNDVEKNGLLNLHHIIDDDIHLKLLNKQNRILPTSIVEFLKTTSFFKEMENVFGKYYLADEEEIGREQICFRIVRPSKKTDIGSWHKDSWFWNQYKFKKPVDVGRVKGWSQIGGSPELSGLSFVPKTHLKKIEYDTKHEDGKLSFVPDSSVDFAEKVTFSGLLGQFVLFNYDILHVGAPNLSESCRISIETTFCFKQVSLS